jgi:hypothetical protein
VLAARAGLHPPGAPGLVLVIAVQLGLVTCMGVCKPVFATYRLDQTETDRVAGTLSAWSVTSNATIAALTALWGLLASITSTRAAIGIAVCSSWPRRSCYPAATARPSAGGNWPGAAPDTSQPATDARRRTAAGRRSSRPLSSQVVAPQQDSNLRTRLRRRLVVSLMSCPDGYPISRMDHVWTAKPRFGVTGYMLESRRSTRCSATI